MSQPVTDRSASRVPGITARSLPACVLAMLLVGMLTQYVEVILADGSAFAEHVLPLPVMTVLLVLSVGCSLVWAAGRFRLLTRQELLCVFFTMTLAAPLMTQGMWHRLVGLIAAPPRSGDFSYLDAYSDKLWPHGDNLAAGAVRQDNPAVTWQGNPPAWDEMTLSDGTRAAVPVLSNTSDGQVSTITLALPSSADDPSRGVVAGEPYMISFLALAEGLGSNSEYFARLHSGDPAHYSQPIRDNRQKSATFLHPGGFVRVGAYGVRMPEARGQPTMLVIGLRGAGRLAVADVKVLGVGTLERAYSGRTIATSEQWRGMSEAERQHAVLRPDSLWSPRGAWFLLSGYIPLRDWLTPAIAWSAPVLLVLAATFAMAVLMRRHWAESERYPFPLFRIPRALLGEEGEPDDRAWPAVWRNSAVWVGLAAGFFWPLLRGAHFYNPSVPDLGVNLRLDDFITHPAWGGMWNVTFTLSALYLSICLFFELNVLSSLLVGYLLYRLLFWVGQTSGANSFVGYPFRYEQSMGAYLGYAAIVLIVSRRHLWGLCKAAVSGESASPGEPLSTRAAVLLLLATPVGAFLWARWLGVAPGGILLFFGFLVVIGFVAAKLRAECGLPFGYFTPYNAMLFVGLLGGMSFFGAEGVMVCLVTSGFLTVSVFFLIPGAQVELIEFGRRYGVIPRHLLYTAVLGALGGLFIGGWVFLSNAYALGGNTIRYQWAFNQNWFFGSYRAQLAEATSRMLNAAADSPQTGIQPATWAYGYGAAGAVLITAARQVFPGLWFHPVGFIVGSSHMMDGVWGSVLVALAVRGGTLIVFGARAHRERVAPFAVGLFIGAMLSVLVFAAYSAYLRSMGVAATYSAIP